MHFRWDQKYKGEDGNVAVLIDPSGKRKPRFEDSFVGSRYLPDWLKFLADHERDAASVQDAELASALQQAKSCVQSLIAANAAKRTLKQVKSTTAAQLVIDGGEFFGHFKRICARLLAEGLPVPPVTISNDVVHADMLIRALFHSERKLIEAVPETPGARSRYCLHSYRDLCDQCRRYVECKAAEKNLTICVTSSVAYIHTAGTPRLPFVTYNYLAS